ncbi:MAG: response regulator [Nitrospirae bacterium]|nr:response regulator [Nitrospirota bacterium]
MNILLVEDEQTLASTLKEGLEMDGHFVDIAGDGTDGMSKAEQHPNDVIIMDVILPLMDGLTTLSALREKGIMTPVILLTADDAVVNQTKRADVAASEYPVGQLALGLLVSKVRYLLRKSLH